MNRPGLAKARGLPLVHSRRAVLVRAPDPRWRELFERADIVSEGCARDEAGGRVWYGSTSLILRIEPDAAPGGAPFLAGLAARDVHIRLRAVRTAHREASLRAPGRLGRFACEIRVEPDARGVRIDVDVQAPLIERRASPRAAR
ncbi:MAG TPA: hypothetical protein VIF15_00520 [Polyangiaceae bacterium]